MDVRRACISTCVISALLAAWRIAAQTPGAEEALERHRNLGKAFYENPTTHAEAIAEFKQALDLAPNSVREKLDYALALLRGGKVAEGLAGLEAVQKQDPSLPYTWFNLGIAYKKAGDTQKALVQFQKMVALVPQEPIAHYQLGTVYSTMDRGAQALAEFEQASRLDPLLAAAHFQLYNVYRQRGRQQDAAKQLEVFQKLKQQSQGAAIPEDVEWCAYAEIYDPPRSSAPPIQAANPRYDDKVLDLTVDAPTAGLAAIDATGTGRADLLVWSAKGVILYRDGAAVADSGLAGIKAALFVAPGDFDNDGLMDLCVLTETGPLLYRNTKGHFTLAPANLPKRRFQRAVWIDYDHDYDLDLVLLGESPALMRNQGAAGFVDRTPDFPFAAGKPVSALRLRVVPDSKAFDLAVFYQDHAPVLYRDQLGGRYTARPYTGPPPGSTELEADFDNDGRPDRARIERDGKVHLMMNRGPSNQRWIRVQLAGIKNLKLAQDALVEVKAGTLYRKQAYAGVPLLFDTGGNSTVDVVRVTWPNGLIQNETRQAANRAYLYKEAQRLSGSCPMIWTWNGRQFQFITDVLGVAPLGASDGDGSYFPVDHDEYVQIPESALAPENGHYQIRLTEELSEVSYIDQVQLFVLDHPVGTEVFTNEKFKGPPYPEFRLYHSARRIYPISARDDRGTDVLPLVLRRDQKYPDQFARTQLGVAELHTLELDFGNAAPSRNAVVLLNGWVDWPDGSTFRAAAQEQPGGLIMPRLEMQDASGRWVTVNLDMGMPAGKPKTIAVPVTFISSSRRLRIVTNLCVYWDEIFLSEDTGRAEARLAPVPQVAATLRFRGFSESRIDPDRKQPDTFLYDQAGAAPFWNPTPGFYTRYGDVRALLARVDDRYVVMGSGDELRLLFDAAALAPPPSGWTREYLMKVDGWAKDRDPNTAFSASVEPLPFHGMSRYPYPADEHYPRDAAHQRYLREYNTRPALRLVRPLGSGT